LADLRHRDAGDVLLNLAGEIRVGDLSPHIGALRLAGGGRDVRPPESGEAETEQQANHEQAAGSHSLTRARAT